MGSIIITRRGGQFRPKPRELTIYAPPMTGQSVFTFYQADDPWNRYAGVLWLPDRIGFETIPINDAYPPETLSGIASIRKYDLTDFTSLVHDSGTFSGVVYIGTSSKPWQKPIARGNSGASGYNTHAVAKIDIKSLKGEYYVGMWGVMRGLGLYSMKLVRE